VSDDDDDNDGERTGWQESIEHNNKSTFLEWEVVVHSERTWLISQTRWSCLLRVRISSPWIDYGLTVRTHPPSTRNGRCDRMWAITANRLLDGAMHEDRKKPNKASMTCLCFSTHVSDLLSRRWMYQIYWVSQSSIVCTMNEFVLLEQSREKKVLLSCRVASPGEGEKELRSLSEPPVARICEHRQQRDHASE
jgi:hypothetical protein